MMSFSMWFWRIIVPGAGLLTSVLVLWYSLHATEAPARLVERPASSTPGGTRVTRGRRVVAEGRLAPRPGAEVTLSSEIGGAVVNLAVREKAKVRKGDLLVELRSDDQRAAVAEAEARLAEADADFGLQRRVYLRRVRAAIDNTDILRELDTIRRDLVVAEARHKAAVASVAQARSVLERTRILAPIDGVVTACFVRSGETVVPATRLLTVCDLSRTWIEAEVDEFDAPRIAEGAEATTTAEGYGEASWKGVVAEVPDIVADRTVRPEDPGRPSDTRVLLVKIELKTPAPLRLGQRVEVEIQASR